MRKNSTNRGVSRKSRMVIGRESGVHDEYVLNQAERVKRRKADKSHLEEAISGMSSL